MTPDLLRDETPPKGNARSSGYDRQTNDWYREPRRAIDALLDVEKFDGTIWDPACGSGNIPIACKHRGYETLASDLIDRGYLDRWPEDFLGPTERDADNIITNPPFSLGVEFTLKALDICPGKVCVLQRTVWLEGERRYSALFSKGHLMRVWQFRSRISMPPGDSASEPKGGSVAFCWYVFSRAHQGPWTGGWLP